MILNVESDPAARESVRPADLFEIAGGSVIGSYHRHVGRNYQDAARWITEPAIIAAVADGCGSALHSEVGAGLGAGLLVEALRRRAQIIDEADPATILGVVRLDMLDTLRRLTSELSSSTESALAAIQEMFLFTLIGAVITARRYFCFAIGDGLIAIDGRVRVLEAAENRPSYLGYGLLTKAEALSSRFQIHAAGDTESLDSILIGTDGAAPLVSVGDQNGGISRFWKEDRFFRHPHAITRELNRINMASPRPGRAVGRLEDDTTLVVIRRRV